MSTPVLATKLYIPPPQPKAVVRSGLIERLNEGLGSKLTLISAPAGFGKTMLVSEWVARSERPAAWLSLDEGDSDPSRFLTYLISALQAVAPNIGAGLLGALQSPQPPLIESVLASLLNEVAAIPDQFTLVLDDYHVVDAKPVDDALAFLIERMPPQMHLVITTREDPQLPLSRLRARGQLTELRANDLRFASSEAAEFLNQVMGLNLTADDIAALESRTEGWVAGLQLAAISMRGHDNTAEFIKSFSGSHRFVLDYLMEEVLNQQPDNVQEFLLNTSVLDRMCGPLCDAVLLVPAGTGQETLEHLERANLFTVPLDDERRWFRYHHLFRDLLRQRLSRADGHSGGDSPSDTAELQVRASAWFEAQGLELEAFHYAAAANDVARAERLAEANGTPLHVRGAAAPVLNWLESLPEEALNDRPSLWLMFASALSVIGKLSRTEQTLKSAEAAIAGRETEDEVRDLVTRIADLRELLGLLTADPQQIESTIAQSRRALEWVDSGNQRLQAFAIWKLGLAYFYRGDRIAARRALTEANRVGEASGNTHIRILASTILGKLHESDNQLERAAETYRHVLHLVGDPPGPVACEAHAGLARICYEWNDLDTAKQHGLQSLNLARQVELASYVSSELILARLHLAEDDVDGALNSLAETAQTVKQRNFWFRIPEVAEAQVRALLRRGDLPEAAQLAEKHDLPLSRARVHLAGGDPSAALIELEALRQQMEEKDWQDELLRAIVLQAVALDAHGDQEAALQVLSKALEMAEPDGFVRTFLDEGAPMAHLLSDAASLGTAPSYTGRLLAAFEAEGHTIAVPHPAPASRPAQGLIEPLSERELEILALIAAGLSNNEIADRLYLALSTVKGHNRNIFAKLQVQRRTEAIARARELGLI